MRYAGSSRMLVCRPNPGPKVFAYLTVASGDWAKWSVP
jgi:hypothetical protein